MDWKKILIILSILILIGGNIAQIFLWNKKMAKQADDWGLRVDELQTQLDAYGQQISVFTVKNETKYGKPITSENLQTITIPSSLISENYIQDEEELKGKFFKVNIAPGTPITTDIIMGERISDDDRELDLYADVIPIGIEVGDFIDFRITYPNGENFIVLSHKRVIAINDGVLKIHIGEEERHLWEGATVDYLLKKNQGAWTSAVKYIEGGIQTGAEVYYSVPKEVAAIISIDPNIKKVIYKDTDGIKRELIDSAISAYDPKKNDQDSEDINNLNQGRTDYKEKINQAAAVYLQVQEAQAQEDAMNQEFSDYEASDPEPEEAEIEE